MSTEKSMKNLSDKKANDNENISNCKYRDKSYFSNLHVKLKSNAFLSFNLM